MLTRDFYGKELLLFGGTSEEKEKGGLDNVLNGMDEEKRKRVLSAVKENLMTMSGGS